MTPTASPRHPWKALAVVLAMFVAVHGVRAHTPWHDHGVEHVTISDSSDDGDIDIDDCRGIEVHIDDDGPDDDPVIDVFDGTEWS